MLHTARQLKYKRTASGVPPLTLQNVIAGKLIDYKIYGNSIQNGTPSVDNPVEIENVGDQTKNLFDFKKLAEPNDIANGKVLEVYDSGVKVQGNESSTPGTMHYANGWFRPGILNKNGHCKVYAETGTDIYISADVVLLQQYNDNSNVMNIYAYGASQIANQSSPKKLVLNQKTRVSQKITVDKTGEYYAVFTLCSNILLIENIMVSKSSDTNYEPYGYKIPVIVKGKNLFDKNTVQEGFIDNADGVFKSSNLYFASDYIEIPSQAATLTITNTGNAMWGAFYGASKQFVAGLIGYKQPKIIPENAKYLRITIAKAFLDTMQVEEGSTATEYEAYIEPVTTNIYLDEPLRKKDNCADYLDYANQKVVRKVEVTDDTGTLPIEQSLQPLPVPTEEDITLPDIAVSDGTDIVDVTTTVKPSNMELEYYSKEKE